MHVYVKPSSKLSKSKQNKVWRAINRDCLPEKHQDPETYLQYNVEELPALFSNVIKRFNRRGT